MPDPFPESGGLFGRDRELAVIDAWVRSPGTRRALVLTGAPGMGKTALWEAGLDTARQRGVRVLLARGSGAETRLSFAALIDLLDGVELDGLAHLPSPQRHALEVALLRAEASGSPPEAHAIAVGLLNALRALTSSGPVLVAIDDFQWLDTASLEALAFVARRLEDASVVFLLARRPGTPPAVERALGEATCERVVVGPLSIGATRRMLFERLGLTLPRHVLRRVFDSTLGSPLFALEVGRMLAARGTPGLTESLPVPEAVDDLLGTRVAQLSPPVRTLLLALALDADLRVAHLRAIAGTGVLDDAVDAGVVVVEGDRARPAHPLLAAAARESARARERRELHMRLAEVVNEEERRALHLALANQDPDEALAARTANAAATASAHGAVRQAVVLSEHALRLTPPGVEERSERLLELAGYLEVAGERQQVTDLLTPALESFSRRDRVRAYLRLAEGGAIKSNYDTIEYLNLALAGTDDDDVLRAYVLAKKSHLTPSYVWQVPEAEGWAREALTIGRRGGPVLERLALHGLAWARALRGHAIDDICSRFEAASDAAAHITESPGPVQGLRLLWRGQVDEARTILADFLTLADARGEEVSYALQRLQMCDLELRAGDWPAATRILDEWESADRQLLIRATYERSRALLAAGRGAPEEAERWAASALAGAEPGGYHWQVLEALRARGVASLLAHDPAGAAASLGAVWEHTRRHGVDEPGAFPVAADLVEALVELGRLDEATGVIDRLRQLSQEQDHPWGLASARRCASMIHLAVAGGDEDAATELEGAASAYGALGLRFDHARTLLTLGRAHRRAKKWGAARRALERAASAFDEIGSRGWADDARSELVRVGGRRPRQAGELTPAERRVAELAADGLANKEIATSLFVTVRTVEVHLKHAYAKLGIRSRTQLASRLSSRP